MAVALVQSDVTGYASGSQSITFAAPTEGNLILCVSIHRSATAAYTGGTGSGWTYIDQDSETEFEIDDGTYRLALGFAYRTATAADSLTGSPLFASNSHACIAMEFSGVTDGTMLSQVGGGTGTTKNLTSVASGATASMSGQVLQVAIHGVKRELNDPNGESQSFDSSPTAVADFQGSTWQVDLWAAWEEITASGTSNVTASISGGDTDNTAMCCALINFQVSAAAAAGSTYPPPTRRFLHNLVR